MRIITETVGGRSVARIEENRIDAAAAIQFKDRMREIAQATTGDIILDMSNVGFLDSSGLGAVVAVMKALAPNRRLELAELTPAVGRVFRLTRLDGIFTIHDTLPVAKRHAG
jgi:anti-sigma B factor antagonist